MRAEIRIYTDGGDLVEFVPATMEVNVDWRFPLLANGMIWEGFEFKFKVHPDPLGGFKDRLTFDSSMPLPEATANPCNDCPWVRSAIKGWLGPYSAEEWIEMAQGEVPIACHQTIKHTDDDGYGEWDDPAMRQCRGAAIFRANICKSPRDHEVARGPRDTKRVFARVQEFLDHHNSFLATWLAERRGD